MKLKKIKWFIVAIMLNLIATQNICETAQHSGNSVKKTENAIGNIGDIYYEMWADKGVNSATFYSDGSFYCSFSNTMDYLCRTGLSFDSTKTHEQIGHMYADYKLIKQNIQNVDYSFVGVYGWSRYPLVEFYIVENWLSQYRPGDWVGNEKKGVFLIDGAYFTVYKNTRTGPSIDGDTTFTQYFSIRDNPRDCGTIDITAHFKVWEQQGMKLGRMHEAKILGEAGSNSYGTSGSVDFPYAKVYIANNNVTPSSKIIDHPNIINKDIKNKSLNDNTLSSSSKNSFSSIDISAFDIAMEMKEKIEKTLNKTFTIYQPISYKTKINGGKIFLFKIKIDNDSYIHVKIHKLPIYSSDNILILIQDNKTLEDEIEL